MSVVQKKKSYSNATALYLPGKLPQEIVRHFRYLQVNRMFMQCCKTPLHGMAKHSRQLHQSCFTHQFERLWVYVRPIQNCTSVNILRIALLLEDHKASTTTLKEGRKSVGKCCFSAVLLRVFLGTSPKFSIVATSILWRHMWYSKFIEFRSVTLLFHRIFQKSNVYQML